MKQRMQADPLFSLCFSGYLGGTFIIFTTKFLLISKFKIIIIVFLREG